jgi:hypothetical protein
MAVARLSRQTSGAPRIYSTSLWRRQAAAARPRQVTPAAILNDIRIKESAYDNASVVMLGAGNMGGAMLRGWLHSGVVPPGCLAACVRSERSQHAWRELGLQVSFTPPAAMCFENLVELKRSPCLILVSWSAPPDKIAEIFYEHLVRMNRNLQRGNGCLCTSQISEVRCKSCRLSGGMFPLRTQPACIA